MYLDELKVSNHCFARWRAAHLNSANQFRHDGNTPISSLHQSLGDLPSAALPGGDLP